MRKLKRRVDDLANISLNDTKSATARPDDFKRLENHVEKRLASIEEQLQDKASKQSVAQALHRKANKPELDESLSAKADFNEIKKLRELIDQKVDRNQIAALHKAIDQKADKFEVVSGPRGGIASFDQDRLQS